MGKGNAAKSKQCKLAIFSAFMLVLYCIAIFASSLFCWKFDVPKHDADIVFYIIWVGGVVISALVFSALSTSKGWLNGMIGGAVFMAGAFLLNFLVCKGEIDLPDFIIKLPLFFLLAFICGIFGVNMRR